METILLLTKENYDALKWLNQFKSTDHARPQLRCVHVIGASLVTGDGFAIGRIDIPDVLKDYCKKRRTFDLVKLVTSPYLAIVDDYPETGFDGFEKVLEDSKSVATLDNLRTVMSKYMFKKISTMPSDTDAVKFYVSDEVTSAVVAVSTKGYSILMPMHNPDLHAKARLHEEKLEKEKENG